jgi:hypothetical protein
MPKRVVRKPTRDEKPYIDRIRDAGGMDFYKHDWPALAPLVAEGLLAWSEPKGMGNAFRRVTVPDKVDW